MMATGDYTKQVHLSASPDRVFEILTTAAEFTSWWAPATGSAAEGGDLQIIFDGIKDPLVLQVKQATRPCGDLGRRRLRLPARLGRHHTHLHTERA